jgi:hypothetical protein
VVVCVKFVGFDFKVCTVAMFVRMLTIYLHTEFHIPSFQCSLINVVKLENNGYFYKIILLFYNIKIITLTKVAYFSKFYYR